MSLVREWKTLVGGDQTTHPYCSVPNFSLSWHPIENRRVEYLVGSNTYTIAPSQQSERRFVPLF
jgi:hypothetical protein